jgi:hypothetical protein
MLFILTTALGFFFIYLAEYEFGQITGKCRQCSAFVHVTVNLNHVLLYAIFLQGLDLSFALAVISWSEVFGARNACV